MPLQNLEKKLAQIRSHGFRPIDPRKFRHSRTQHLRRDLSRLRRQLRRCDPFIVDAYQAIGQGVIESPAAVKSVSTNQTLRELRQESHEPRHPQLKVR